MELSILGGLVVNGVEIQLQVQRGTAAREKEEEEEEEEGINQLEHDKK